MTDSPARIIPAASVTGEEAQARIAALEAQLAEARAHRDFWQHECTEAAKDANQRRLDSARLRMALEIAAVRLDSMARALLALGATSPSYREWAEEAEAALAEPRPEAPKDRS